MVNYWQPGIQYDRGNVVEFNGARYRVIQAHFSQSDWEPSPNTAAIWGRIPEGEYDHHTDCYDHENYHEEKQTLTDPYCQPHQTETPPQQQAYAPQTAEHYSEEKADIPHEEHKKKLWNLSDDRKKQLEIGGALMAGVATIGAGYYAYHKHEQKEEKKKAHVWTFESWLADAKARAEFYNCNGPRAPLTWVLIEGHNIPSNAFAAGDEGGKPLYFCRVFCDGGIQVGKAGLHLSKGAAYGYTHKSFDVGTYEILVGDSRAVKWVAASGKLRPDQLGARLVEGGQENDGTPIYLAQAEHHGHHPGKTTTVLNGAYIAYGQGEERVKEYLVLCYA